jgi:hypothetical protein
LLNVTDQSPGPLTKVGSALVFVIVTWEVTRVSFVFHLQISFSYTRAVVSDTSQSQNTSWITVTDLE